MSQITTVDVASHAMDYVLSQLGLQPLLNKYVLLPYLNRSNIDGIPSGVRKIPKGGKLTEAEDDDEGVAIADSATYADDTAITLTPTKKRKRLNTTIDALQRRMPGSTRAQVIEAVKNGTTAAVPLLMEQAGLVRDSQLQRAEREGLALFSSLSESAGVTNTALAFTHIVDAQVKLLDNKPEHEAHIIMLDEKGVGDLRSSVVSGASASLSSIWADGFAQSFLDHVPDPNRMGFRGSVLGAPIYAADKDMMTTANAGVDRQGAVFCVGRGETGAPGSLRGFAEFCEAFVMDLQMAFNLLGDDVDVVGRWKWALGEHTDPHGVGLIYKV